MTNRGTLLVDLTTCLTSISDTPALDASVLVAHITNKPRTWVMAHPELTLTSDQQNQLNDSLARLGAGEPFPYIIGNWEFFGLNFEITPEVLIPRPETELLVEKAIAWLKKNPGKRNVADIGTGAGVIAISIALHIPDSNILATDVSPKALDVARRNAEKYDMGKRIEFIQCDLLPDRRPQTVDLSSSFDLICANLPYVPTRKLHDLPVYQREPTSALDGGEDGLDLLRRLMEISPAWLSPNGLILLEIEATQGMAALSLARDAFAETQISLSKDLAGRDRLLQIAFTRLPHD
jgi:release factor glutamine methyltransferase